MHIPDGYLGPITFGSLWAAMLPVWYFAGRLVRKTMDVARIPFLALAGAFSFVIMMFNVPVPGGTTGHATGATLIAILLGPWPAVIAVSIALIIQAVLFGDGGITAIGANCFNMAFAEVMAGYGVYRLIGGKIGSKRELLAAGAGSYIGINVAAFLTALELGIQPLLHRGLDGRPLYSPFPLTITVPAIMIEHITLFGFVEVAVTVLVLVYVRKKAIV
ncbi:MAG: cobalt transporter CbiM [Thermodesulfovibrionales bacterium]